MHTLIEGLVGCRFQTCWQSGRSGKPHEVPRHLADENNSGFAAFGMLLVHIMYIKQFEYYHNYSSFRSLECSRYCPHDAHIAYNCLISELLV